MTRPIYEHLTGNEELKDVVEPGNKEYQRISIGNCVGHVHRASKTISLLMGGDEEWPIESARCWIRILEYIETTYGR